MKVHGNEYSGKLETPLHLKGVRGARLFGLEGIVWLEDCQDVRIKDSNLRLKAQGVRGLKAWDTKFDAGGKKIDACEVLGDSPKVPLHSYFEKIWEAKTWDTENLVYGRPDAFYKGLTWERTVSHRTGQEIWKGYDRRKFSRDVEFLRCDFSDSGKAGLFVHHTSGISVRECTGSNNVDYDLGGEWIEGSEWISNSCDQIVSHFMNLHARYSGNKVKNLTLNSQGEPVKHIVIEGGEVLGDGWQSGRIAIRNGHVFGYNLAGWIEDVTIRNGICNFIVAMSGQVENKEPEVMVKDLKILNQDIRHNPKNWFKDEAIRLESVDGYLLEGNNLNGGHVNIYSVGGRVPSRPLTSSTPVPPTSFP